MKKILIIPLLLCILIEISAAQKIIRLPQPKVSSPMSLEESILRRRSERAYYNNSLTQEQISQLLWATQGITEPSWKFRAAPSSGAIYPLEIYIINKNGTYHYLPEQHALEELSKIDNRQALAQAALGQSFIAEAPVDILISAVYAKSRKKYGMRAERYVYMEAGHAAENLHLQAVSLGLGSVPVGAFWDDVVKKIINLPPDEYPLYIIPVGYAKTS